MNRRFRKTALVLIALVFLFALFSFLWENWSAAERPGALESFLARIALSRARNADRDVKNPLLPTPENLEEGRRIYEKQCAFCHGQDGSGQGQTGLQFYPPVPSLLEHATEMSDGQIQHVVTKGIRYTAMPSFAKQLTPEEIWKVTLWVRQLRKPVTSDQKAISDHPTAVGNR